MGDERQPEDLSSSGRNVWDDPALGCVGIPLLNLIGLPFSIASLPFAVEMIKSGADTGEKITGAILAGLLGLIGVGTIAIDIQIAREFIIGLRRRQ